MNAEPNSKSVKKKRAAKKGISDQKDIIIGLTLLVLLAISIVVTMSFSDKEEVIAKVNGEEIYQKQFENLENQYLAQYGEVPARSAVIEQLVTEKLLLQSAKESGIVVKEEEFQKTLNDYLNITGKTEADFKETLNNDGIDWNDFEKSTINQIYIMKYINETISSKVVISETMIQEIYDQVGAEQPLEEIRQQIEMFARIQQQNLLLKELTDQLKSVAEIEIIGQEESPFKETGKELCEEDGKKIVRLYTSKECEPCEWISQTFKEVSVELSELGSFYNWDLSTGDNLLTEEIESAIPKAEWDLFKEVNPQMGLPLYIVGCESSKTGTSFESNDSELEKQELMNIIRGVN
jgi:hypothetical protein